MSRVTRSTIFFQAFKKGSKHKNTLVIIMFLLTVSEATLPCFSRFIPVNYDKHSINLESVQQDEQSINIQGSIKKENGSPVSDIHIITGLFGEKLPLISPYKTVKIHQLSITVQKFQKYLMTINIAFAIMAGIVFLDIFAEHYDKFAKNLIIICLISWFILYPISVFLNFYLGLALAISVAFSLWHKQKNRANLMINIWVILIILSSSKNHLDHQGIAQPLKPLIKMPVSMIESRENKTDGNGIFQCEIVLDKAILNKIVLNEEKLGKAILDEKASEKEMPDEKDSQAGIFRNDSSLWLGIYAIDKSGATDILWKEIPYSSTD